MKKARMRQLLGKKLHKTVIRPGEPYRTVMTDKEFTQEEDDFRSACEVYQKVHQRKFLSHTEYLWIAKNLGYHKGTVIIKEKERIIRCKGGVFPL